VASQNPDRSHNRKVRTGGAERPPARPDSCADHRVERNQFVAVRNSPWDNDGLDGPFSVADFLVWATFRASDELGECDSWNTQMDYYGKTIERLVNAYSRGPKASLIAILRDAIDWNANRLAEELAVKEIRFKQDGAGRSSWRIELV
jgi:hypothetical protein